jgi:hypothetical protein
MSSRRDNNINWSNQTNTSRCSNILLGTSPLTSFKSPLVKISPTLPTRRGMRLRKALLSILSEWIPWSASLEQFSSRYLLRRLAVPFQGSLQMQRKSDKRACLKQSCLDEHIGTNKEYNLHIIASRFFPSLIRKIYSK